MLPYCKGLLSVDMVLRRRIADAQASTVLATRAHAPDSCRLGDCRAGPVKAVFVRTSTGQISGCGCPAATDGLDGFCPPRTIGQLERACRVRGTCGPAGRLEAHKKSSQGRLPSILRAQDQMRSAARSQRAKRRIENALRDPSEPGGDEWGLGTYWAQPAAGGRYQP
jgi:hypothetical protein